MSIEVKGLTHIYSEGLPHESVALENVSFNVEDGQLVGVIGHCLLYTSDAADEL